MVDDLIRLHTGAGAEVLDYPATVALKIAFPIFLVFSKLMIICSAKGA